MDVLELRRGMDIVNALPEYTKPEHAGLMAEACCTSKGTLRLCGQYDASPAGYHEG